ncbi:TPA: SMC-Scp complex subunit ScpB [Candidatus Woesearchaeota archaeon]|nr:SMC-Scp complex subunit ScpB [Candidatus Woesearchaeota archaeon]
METKNRRQEAKHPPHKAEVPSAHNHPDAITSETKNPQQTITPNKKGRVGPSPKLQIEALLFSSGKTMSEESLAELSKLDPRTVKRALNDLQREYGERDSAITIYNDPTGWKMMVRELYVSTVKNIVADTELTRACMETLAVIAYKYPKVLQSEVIDIRGSGAYEHMSELERLGFINRSSEGRSYAVKLTDKFFSYFDVAGGKDIREVFKNVKVPKRVAIDAQKTLGDLQIINITKKPENADGSHDDKVSGMEVVDVPPPSAAPANAAPADENDASDGTGTQTEEGAQDASAHSEFLDDLDRRIAAIGERNTANENDESLRRRPLPGAETPTEGDNPDAAGSEESLQEETDEKKE